MFHIPAHKSTTAAQIEIASHRPMDAQMQRLQLAQRYFDAAERIADPVQSLAAICHGMRVDPDWINRDSRPMRADALFRNS